VSGQLSRRHRIQPRTALGVRLCAGEKIRVIDINGGQVADLVAFARGDRSEWLSNGRSFDYNQSIRVQVGQELYSNRSRAMLRIVEDDVGRHDFLYTACSPEMFERQYGETAHPNCLENMTVALIDAGLEGMRAALLPTPLNLFMNVQIAADGGLTIAPPISRPGEGITLLALMDLVVALSACSAVECNGGTCTGLEIEISSG
jgi:uncharacterized protein YcgI (DUF1989 family)